MVNLRLHGITTAITGHERKTMSSEKTSMSAPCALHCYAVGDRVRMLDTITEGPSSELPAQHFCEKGEVLIVRKVTDEKRPRNGVWPFYVSHEHITDQSFGVMLNQIEPA